MLHPSIASRYVVHRGYYLRLLRLCFALAGTYWIIIYLLPEEHHIALRSGQTVIYFILMTLWGLDYMREQRRLALVITTANARHVPPNEIVFDEVAQRASLFTMLRPVGGFAGTLLPILFLVGLLVAYALVILQYVRVFAVI